MNIQERLAIFYERLAAAPPAKNAEGALELICRMLEEVEDEFCPVPKKDPAPQSFDGRMYLPQADNIRTGLKNWLWVRTRHHRIAIKPDGSFDVFRGMPHKTLFSEFRKAGADR